MVADIDSNGTEAAATGPRIAFRSLRADEATRRAPATGGLRAVDVPIRSVYVEVAVNAESGTWTSRAVEQCAAVCAVASVNSVCAVYTVGARRTGVAFGPL